VVYFYSISGFVFLKDDDVIKLAEQNWAHMAGLIW
jgi:hypothetical protein